VTPRDAPAVFEFVAQTQSSRQVNIQARVSGFLEKRVYTEGSLVKEGQVLFLMDAKPFQVQVDAHAAELAKQQASLDMARANLEAGPLAEKTRCPRRTWTTRPAVPRRRGGIGEARAKLRPQLDLSYCTIVSPVDGITGAAQQQDGTYISPQNSLLTTVAVLSPIWVNFSLSENELQRYRDEAARGVLRAPATGEYEVEVLLPDGSLFPHIGRITFASRRSAGPGTFMPRVATPDGCCGEPVRAGADQGDRPAILVPQRAVQQGAEGHFVWVVGKGDTAELRPVAVGTWQGEDWFIEEGLHAGEQVVVDGLLGLRAGVPLSVKPAV
jgi:membrane fusion protein (multidrug efflux system)